MIMQRTNCSFVVKRFTPLNIVRLRSRHNGNLQFGFIKNKAGQKFRFVEKRQSAAALQNLTECRAAVRLAKRLRSRCH